MSETLATVRVSLSRPPNFLKLTDYALEPGHMIDVGTLSDEDAAEIGQAFAAQFVEHVKKRRKKRQ